jgi:hypothetical protein
VTEQAPVGYIWYMPDSAEPDRTTDEVLAQSAAARARSEELQEQVSATAAAVAATEDEVADVHERLAGDPHTVMSADALAHAARARRFADQERQEEQRWGTRRQDEAKGSEPPD